MATVAEAALGQGKLCGLLRMPLHTFVFARLMCCANATTHIDCLVRGSSDVSMLVCLTNQAGCELWPWVNQPMVQHMLREMPDAWRPATRPPSHITKHNLPQIVLHSYAIDWQHATTSRALQGEVTDVALDSNHSYSRTWSLYYPTPLRRW